MKQYDKIYIPCNYMESDATVLAGGSSIRRSCREEKDVIVLSIEQLREMWNTAMERRDRDVWMRDIGEDNYNTAPTFEEYLTEQGITI